MKARTARTEKKTNNKKKDEEKKKEKWNSLPLKLKI